MTPSIKVASAALTLAVLLGAAACSQPAEAPAGIEAAADAIPASADVHPFAIGDLQLAALRDGTLTLPLDHTPWGDAAVVAAILTEAGEDGDAVHLSVQPLLVRQGDRVVLIDTGAGGQMGTQNGLPGALAAAGVDAAEVTDILISHAHGDHIGGLLNAGGALAFPNAVIRMSAPEWRALQTGAEAQGLAALVTAITPQVRPFEHGAAITPFLTAVPLDGHTAGHSGFAIISGDERLLYIGDALHSAVISVRRPELVNAWDIDSDTAVSTRQGLVERGAGEGQRYYGVHFPYPGLGRIEQRDGGFVWTPET
ncbi:MBL fold metallo-hydrolase [Brevundimonas sp.]|uniref:MBL fold metallo-hydrolase n=1 Tax=Brevundimonas sp. TaxID=1871086 RepID=UPI00391B6583